MKISQAERMLNLLALLVDRNRPLTLRAVRQELGKQYPNSDEAARAAFERDKAALREMGIPIETKTLGGDSAGEVTYWVNRSNYELSDLKLSDDERVALQLAVATVRLGAQHGEEALWKLGGEKVLRPTAVSVNIGFVDQNMSSITTAVMQRRTLNFDYKGEKRQVDPYGMLSRSGFWYLIGFDHLRKDQRVFRVDRIEGKVTAGQMRSFKTPVGFDVAAAVPTEKQMMAAGEENLRRRPCWWMHRWRPECEMNSVMLQLSESAQTEASSSRFLVRICRLFVCGCLQWLKVQKFSRQHRCAGK